MKKIFTIILTLCFFFLQGYSQKKFTEGSVLYNVSVNTNDPGTKLADGFDGATNTIYIKGNMNRSELVSVFGSQSTIIDGKTGNVTMLKEYGDKKYLINMTAADWMDANRKYDSVTFSYLDEYKNIAGYNCRKAIGKLKSGDSLTVYYTTELVPENQDFQYINRTLPGLALEYEATIGKSRFTFTASKVNFNPVPISKFDLPKSGFRVMSYQESKKPGN
jgi:GLPGLI family protein